MQSTFVDSEQLKDTTGFRNLRSPYASFVLRAERQTFKQAATDPNHGRSFFDGDLEITTHSHGEFIQWQMSVRLQSKPVAEFPKLAENGSGGFGILV